MSSRAWAAWSAAALVVVLTSTNPAYRIIVLLVALNILLTFRRPDASLRGLLIAIGIAGVMATVLNALLSHTGEHTLFSVPTFIPGIGGRVTAEAVLYGLDVGAGITAAVLAMAPLTRVLYPDDLLDGLPRFLQRTVALTGAALNLVPAVARNAVEINEAQRLRGFHGTRLRDWHAVAAPIVLSALDDSLQLAEAMEARGFGATPRTSYVVHRLGPSAVAVIGAAITAVVLVVVARLGGSLPDWFPFPTASLPSISLLPVLACLLLATPLLTWRRS